MAAKRINLFLVHEETGQRYPVSEQDLVIGRTSGDIVFPVDAKLSPQHCRIVKTPTGLAIHDLNSGSGTQVDGLALSPERMYIFKPGSVIHVGDQRLRLQQTNYPKRVLRKPRRRRKKRNTGGFDAFSFVIGLLIILGLGYLGLLHLKATRGKTGMTLPVLSPFEIVDKEVQATFEEYKRIGQSHENGTLTEKQLAFKIRSTLVPGFTAAKTKLGVIRPRSEYERRQLEINRRLVDALLVQMTAYAAFLETKMPRFEAELKSASQNVENLRAEARRARDRAPASR